MRLAHPAARVLDRTAGRGTHLLDQHGLEPRHVGPSELVVDSVVSRRPTDEGVDDRDDGACATESVVQRTLFHHVLPFVKRPDNLSTPDSTPLCKVRDRA
jgi:hypothetical protein